MITLYLKTHNKTGLKYLGKTVKDPYSYNGSGVYWRQHLNKHGDDITTKILWQSEDIKEISQKGREYSKLYNIVESNDFANLMDENGQGGKTKTSFKKGMIPYNKGKKVPALSEAKKKYWNQWREDNPNYKDRWKKYEPVPKDQQKKRGNTHLINKQTIVCPHCKKEGNVGNMKRWHFDNCKQSK